MFHPKYFDFGRGSVPAQRHINPDASLDGLITEVSYAATTAYTGPAAQLFEKARTEDHVELCDASWNYGSANLQHDSPAYPTQNNMKITGLHSVITTIPIE